MKGFKSEEIKKLNRVVLFRSPKNAPVDVLFSAWTDQGYTYSFEVDADDLFGGTHNQLFSTGLGRVIANDKLGITGAIDMSRKMLMKGTKPMSFNVSCFLILKKSYQQDIAEPLDKLLKFALPKRGERLNDKIESFAQNLKDKDEADKTAAGVPGDTFSLWSLLSKGLASLSKWAGDVYNLEIPEQLGENGMGSDLTLQIGNKRVDNVFVRSINISCPKFTMVDENGYPVSDYVEVTLGIETLRTTTADSIDFKTSYKAFDK